MQIRFIITIQWLQPEAAWVTRLRWQGGEGGSGGGGVPKDPGGSVQQEKPFSSKLVVKNVPSERQKRGPRLGESTVSTF